MTDDPKVTPGTEFRAMREQGIPQVLWPGGRVVRLRTVTPDRLLKLGKVPDILTPLVIRMFYDGYVQDDLDKFLDLKETTEEILQQVESLRIVCTLGLVKPRMVDNPEGPDEISFDDLTPSERGWIFRLVFLEAEHLATFRYRPTPDVETVSDGEKDGEQTEPVDDH